MTTIGLTFDDGLLTLTLPEGVAFEVVRGLPIAPEPVAPRAIGDWADLVRESEYADLERDLCLRAEARGWVVERSRSTGPHSRDVNIYPTPGSRKLRLAAFYAPTARVAFHNRVREEDAIGRKGVAPVYDNYGKPGASFAGLRIRLRTQEDIETALDLALVVHERIAE